jgi:hypothetical protein
MPDNFIPGCMASGIFPDLDDRVHLPAPATTVRLVHDSPVCINAEIIRCLTLQGISVLLDSRGRFDEGICMLLHS